MSTRDEWEKSGYHIWAGAWPGSVEGAARMREDAERQAQRALHAQDAQHAQDTQQALHAQHAQHTQYAQYVQSAAGSSPDPIWPAPPDHNWSPQYMQPASPYPYCWRCGYAHPLGGPSRNPTGATPADHNWLSQYAQPASPYPQHQQGGYAVPMTQQQWAQSQANEHHQHAQQGLPTGGLNPDLYRYQQAVAHLYSEHERHTAELFQKEVDDKGKGKLDKR